MSDEIKQGDPVAIVRGAPCCGLLGCHSYYSQYHIEGIVNASDMCKSLVCKKCGHTYKVDTKIAKFIGGRAALLSMVKKIDPPSEGDSLPTRADKEITA